MRIRNLMRVRELTGRLWSPYLSSWIGYPPLVSDPEIGNPFHTVSIYIVRYIDPKIDTPYSNDYNENITCDYFRYLCTDIYNLIIMMDTTVCWFFIHSNIILTDKMKSATEYVETIKWTLENTATSLF